MPTDKHTLRDLCKEQEEFKKRVGWQRAVTGPAKRASALKGGEFRLGGKRAAKATKTTPCRWPVLATPPGQSLALIKSLVQKLSGKLVNLWTKLLTKARAGGQVGERPAGRCAGKCSPGPGLTEDDQGAQANQKRHGGFAERRTGPVFLLVGLLAAHEQRRQEHGH